MAKKKYTSASVINLASGTVRPGQTVALDDADAAALLAAGMIYPAAAEEKTAEEKGYDESDELKVKLEELNILLETKDREIAQLKEELAELKKTDDQEEKVESPEEKAEAAPAEQQGKPAKAKK